MYLFTKKITRSHIIFFVILLFMILALALRSIPALFIQDQGFLHLNQADGWYNMRQIEVMVHNFPQYNWFDPMTSYPYGKLIDWGPLYPLIAATVCKVLGVTSRNDIVNTAGWISPLMATLMVPVTYKIGKLIWDWKAGIVSAGLISIISFQYFIVSSYGWIGHYIAETFFTTLFFLAYLYALTTIRRNPVDINTIKSIIIPAGLSGLTGVLFFLGFITSTTVLLTLLIVGVYTFFRYVLDYVSGQHSEYLLFLNSTFLSLVAVLITWFGFHGVGFSLTTYSAGNLLVVLALIGETVLFYCIARITRNNRIYYGIILAGVVAGMVILLQVYPALQTIRSQVVSLLFGFSPYSVSVTATVPWTLANAYDSFNLALLLMAIGLVILIWQSIKMRRNEHFFLLVWFATMVLVTLLHLRFQYYLTVPIAILAAICITESVQWSLDSIPEFLRLRIPRFPRDNRLQEDRETTSLAKGTTGKPEKRSKKSQGISRVHNGGYIGLLKGITLIGIIILTTLLVAISLSQDYSYGAGTTLQLISPDWTESLAWINASTPLPGVDYFQSYNMSGFSYPNGSYGIMAPWEVGHQITFFTRRLPILSPFQDNLAGTSGGVAFYLAQNESQANTILSRFQGRYVVTDLTTATDRFQSLPPWVNNSEDASPYFTWFFTRDEATPGGLTKTHLLDDAYFQTILIRLQMFDGSLVLPTTAEYTRYTVQDVPDSGDTAVLNGQARITVSQQQVNLSNSPDLVLIPEGDHLETGMSYAGLFSPRLDQPVQKIPALTHYRLVHESPDNLSVILGYGYSILPDIKSVKVFEYVKGARIPGEGFIELPITTNTGRIFVYRQESSNGEFIVPYATEGNPYEVRATGPYHILGTGRYINVTEDDVMQGNPVP
jgi:dolichyl-diphosphooligosaccharide--protein glycosyltransferase